MLNANSAFPPGEEGDIVNTYLKILDVYNYGGNVTRLVDKLNSLLLFVNNVTLRYINDTLTTDYINEVLSSINEDIPYVIEEADKLKTQMLYNYVTYGFISIIIIFILILFFRDWFWHLWLNIRRNVKTVVRKSPAKSGSFYASGEVRAVVAAIVVVVLIFAVSQAYIAGRVIEPFSELGLLGKNMKIGDYPREVFVGEKFLFYIYVGNHMGYPVFYQVRIYVGDNKTPVDPCPLEPKYILYYVLLHNKTWIYPVNMSIEEPGINKRLIVELWIYNLTTNKFEYHKRWTQLWINVTEIR